MKTCVVLWLGLFSFVFFCLGGEGGVACVASYLFLCSLLVFMVFLLFLARLPGPLSPFVPHYCVFEGSVGIEK